MKTQSQTKTNILWVSGYNNAFKKWPLLENGVSTNMEQQYILYIIICIRNYTIFYFKKYIFWFTQKICSLCLVCVSLVQDSADRNANKLQWMFSKTLMSRGGRPDYWGGCVSNAIGTQVREQWIFLMNPRKHSQIS